MKVSYDMATWPMALESIRKVSVTVGFGGVILRCEGTDGNGQRVVTGTWSIWRNIYE